MTNSTNPPEDGQSRYGYQLQQISGRFKHPETLLNTLLHSLMNPVMSTVGFTSLQIAGGIVSLIRKPPFNLPGVSTRQFFMSQWRDDALSLEPGVVRTFYCLARIPDAIHIAIVCCRRKPVSRCDQCNR